MRALRTLVVVAPLVLLGLLLVAPAGDLAWENHPAHFWLVLTTAMVCVGLGGAVGAAARRRRDSRTVLIALACTTAAGFPRTACPGDAGRSAWNQPRFRTRDPCRSRDGRRDRGDLRRGVRAAGCGSDPPAFRMVARVDADGRRLPPWPSCPRSIAPCPRTRLTVGRCRWSYRASPGTGRPRPDTHGCIAAAERRFRCSSRLPLRCWPRQWS
jgi:hypothetical protein